MSKESTTTITIRCDKCKEYLLTGINFPTDVPFGDWSGIKNALIDHEEEHHPPTFEYECVVCRETSDGYDNEVEAAEACLEHMKDDHGGTVRQTDKDDTEQNIYELI